MDRETFEIYLEVGEPGWYRFTGTVSAGVTRNDMVAFGNTSQLERRACFCCLPGVAGCAGA